VKPNACPWEGGKGGEKWYVGTLEGKANGHDFRIEDTGLILSASAGALVRGASTAARNARASASRGGVRASPKVSADQAS